MQHNQIATDLGKLVKRLAPLLACALLAISCDQQPEGADAYRYEGAQWVRDQRVMELKLYPSAKALQAAAGKSGAKPADGHVVVAFSRYPAGRDVCQVNIVDPRVAYAPEFYGHELLHCFRGNWHPNQP